VETIPDYQAAALTDIAEHDRVARVAGHATGKSHAAAIRGERLYVVAADSLGVQRVEAFRVTQAGR
jgi:hypothetical protein